MKLPTIGNNGEESVIEMIPLTTQQSTSRFAVLHPQCFVSPPAARQPAMNFLHSSSCASEQGSSLNVGKWLKARAGVANVRATTERMEVFIVDLWISRTVDQIIKHINPFCSSWIVGNHVGWEVMFVSDLVTSVTLWCRTSLNACRYQSSQKIPTPIPCGLYSMSQRLS